MYTWFVYYLDDALILLEMLWEHDEEWVGRQ